MIKSELKLDITFYHGSYKALMSRKTFWVFLAFGLGFIALKYCAGITEDNATDRTVPARSVNQTRIYILPIALLQTSALTPNFKEGVVGIFLCNCRCKWLSHSQAAQNEATLMRTRRFLNGEMQTLSAVTAVASGFSFNLSLFSLVDQTRIFVGMLCRRT